MQLGKLDVSKASQTLSCKTVRKRHKTDQRVKPTKQNSSFEPLEHSVYVGRRFLGRYERVSAKRYAAYDASGKRLGRFAKRSAALAAIDRAGCNR
jgi:hypothetical protein